VSSCRRGSAARRQRRARRCFLGPVGGREGRSGGRTYLLTGFTGARGPRPGRWCHPAAALRISCAPPSRRRGGRMLRAIRTARLFADSKAEAEGRRGSTRWRHAKSRRCAGERRVDVNGEERGSTRTSLLPAPPPSRTVTRAGPQRAYLLEPGPEPPLSIGGASAGRRRSGAVPHPGAPPVAPPRGPPEPREAPGPVDPDLEQIQTSVVLRLVLIAPLQHLLGSSRSRLLIRIAPNRSEPKGFEPKAKALASI